MRTTLNIEDEVFDRIKQYAEKRKLSLGQATSDLVQLGFHHAPKFNTKNGWVVHDLPLNSPTMTLESLEKLKEEEYEDEFQRALSPRR